MPCYLNTFYPRTQHSVFLSREGQLTCVVWDHLKGLINRLG